MAGWKALPPGSHCPLSSPLGPLSLPATGRERGEEIGVWGRRLRHPQTPSFLPLPAPRRGSEEGALTSVGFLAHESCEQLQRYFHSNGVVEEGTPSTKFFLFSSLPAPLDPMAWAKKPSKAGQKLRKRGFSGGAAPSQPPPLRGGGVSLYFPRPCGGPNMATKRES